MPLTPGDELIALGERLSGLAARADDASFSGPLAALMTAAEEIEKSWSHSSIGYHADVYYSEFHIPPPGAHFSSEWGFMGQFQGSTGDWREYPHDQVLAEIEGRAGKPELAVLRREATDAEKVFRDVHDDAQSLLRAQLARREDEHLRAVLDKMLKVRPLSYEQCVRAQLPQGQLVSRDRLAIMQGRRSAAHQEIIGQVLAIRSPFESAARLSALCRRAARHLGRTGGEIAPSTGRLRTEGRVVIGHGGSPLWRELKDFVDGRLRLAWDEFNRVAVAGVATTDRLQQMVESSVFAFLVATAEDEGPTGTLVARQNVVHEIGLFQGHLGFGRAIVLLEEGCEEFSNIHGLGQIRFPTGNIAACFEDVRRVLEREGLL
jgi:hypothetical protein